MEEEGAIKSRLPATAKTNKNTRTLPVRSDLAGKKKKKKEKQLSAEATDPSPAALLLLFSSPVHIADVNRLPVSEKKHRRIDRVVDSKNKLGQSIDSLANFLAAACCHSIWLLLFS